MTMHRTNDCFIADTARVVGDVRLGADVNIWYGAVVRGDVAPIVIGDGSNVQDNAVIHCDHRYANVIGRNVIIGHAAIVHGECIGDNTLIGMGAVVLGRTRIGAGCLVAAGALVPPGLHVPDHSVVMGVPGKVVRSVTDADREYLAKLPRHYVNLAQRHIDHPDDPTIVTDADLINADLLPK
jgi:carbonic anhydrase/acetyltransferase-like protein (isoleucine patch superfamily)